MERIIVVGAGTMGAGIAMVAASAGFDIDVIEPDPAAFERAKQRIAKGAARTAASGAAGTINWYASLQPGMHAMLAIEAVSERADLKREIFRALEITLGPEALLATNTSSLGVGDLARGLDHPQRVLGLHFFNPPALMQLIEIVRAEQTSDETIALARTFVERLGKTPVIAADTPGFIVNRVARPFYLQAMRAYEAEVAPLEDLDRLARGIGFRMGPFELMDLIGIDVNLATSESIYERTGAQRLEPAALQREMCEQNHLGRKTQAGFYDYAQGPPQHDDAGEKPEAALRADAPLQHKKIAVLGYAGLALEMRERFAEQYRYVESWENEDLLDEITLDTAVVFDVGDGASDRATVLAALDSLLPPETLILADAYATDLRSTAQKMQHPQRLVGYGILGSLANQRVVEIVDTEDVGDEALELAQELFESIGRRVVLVEDRAGLFLGRTVASIVNEAVCVVHEEIATADDVDLAMRLGTNYPQGPIAWGREIGGDRIVRILQRVAREDGAAFAPHRAVRLLDIAHEEPTGEVE